jgi:phenylacetate-CoA ligase
MAAIEIDNGEEVLSKLMGRIEEMAILPSGKKVAGDTLFVYVFKEFAKVCPDITEYKVIQSSAKLFEVNISTSRELTVEELGKLKKLCLNALGDEAEVVVNCKEVLDRTLMGKFKRFERRYNPNA